MFIISDLNINISPMNAIIDNRRENMSSLSRVEIEKIITFLQTQARNISGSIFLIKLSHSQQMF